MIRCFIRKYAAFRWRKIARMHRTAVPDQYRALLRNVKVGCRTQFGKDHGFDKIHTYEDYKERVPLQNYETIKHYIDQIITRGASDVLWKGRPLYIAKTSGSASGSKYIPITKASIGHHIVAAQDAILCYLHNTRKYDLITKRKNIFLQGCPILDLRKGIYFGRLSGISAHHIPKMFRKNNLPSWEVNCISDWEEKVRAIVNETHGLDIGMMAGIPSWLQMYFNYLREKTKKPIGDIYPHLSLLIVGGTAYTPYRPIFEKLIGRPIDVIQVYTASEAFIAIQDTTDIEAGMRLLTRTGTFYEFIPLEEIDHKNPSRVALDGVELHREYVVIVTTNAGLWAYDLGDTIRFVSLNPYRVVVSGRTAHFLSAFGEHVIVKEVEDAITKASVKNDALIREFSVAPQVNPKPSEGEKPYHEWFIEFEKKPADMASFSSELDRSLTDQNIYYKDLRDGNIIQAPKVRLMRAGSFESYMRSVGKLGEQFKIPRLSNDREMADSLSEYSEF